MRYFKKQSELYDDIVHNKFFKWVDKNVDYTGSLLRHKWNVYNAARDLKVPFVQAATHDMTKFDPLLFTLYRDYYSGPKNTDPKFLAPVRAAKNLHKVYDRHHYTGPDSPTNIAMESIADWYGSAKRGMNYPKNFPDLRAYIIKNQDALIKHFGRKHFETALIRASGLE